MGIRKYVTTSLSLSRSPLIYKVVIHEMIPRLDQYPDDWKSWDFDHEQTGTITFWRLWSISSLHYPPRSDSTSREVTQPGLIWRGQWLLAASAGYWDHCGSGGPKSPGSQLGLRHHREERPREAQHRETRGDRDQARAHLWEAQGRTEGIMSGLIPWFTFIIIVHYSISGHSRLRCSVRPWGVSRASCSREKLGNTWRYLW